MLHSLLVSFNAIFVSLVIRKVDFLYIVCPIKVGLGEYIKKKVANEKDMYYEKAKLRNGYTVHLTIGAS